MTQMYTECKITIKSISIQGKGDWIDLISKQDDTQSIEHIVKDIVKEKTASERVSVPIQTSKKVSLFKGFCKTFLN